MFRRRRSRTTDQSLFSTPEFGLGIHCVDDGDTHLVAPTGELDLGSAWILERALERAEKSDAREIVIDLGGLQLIDSTGLHVVIRAAARARAQDLRLLIRRGPPSVHRAFERSGVADRLPFAEYTARIPLP